MKTLGVIVLGLTIAFVSAIAAKHVTTASLTGEGSVFKDFDQVDTVWLFSDKIGAATASDVERAKVAINGPLGLSAKEAVYFVALTDNQGQALTSECDYRVSGTPLDTRWWSLTLYDQNTQHYVANVDNRSSWNNVAIPREDNGTWALTISQTPKESPWLPSQTEDGQAFDLILRIYNPSNATRAALPNINLPNVERTSC